MRSTGFTATLLLMTAIGQAQTLTTAHARAHDDETATVCGVIASEHVAASSRGKPTFIDLDSEIRRYDFEQFARSGSQESARPLTITPRKGQPGCTDAPEGKEPGSFERTQRYG
jgi:hypothetical protein